MVYPSGGERTARPTPIEPPAPVTFSTRMASPSVVFMRSPRMRIIASDGPPAANGTMTVIGREGKFSARAVPPPNASMANNAAKTVLRITPSGDAALRILQLRVVDRLMAIERARHRRQRVFKACGAIEQHHAITFADAAVGEALLIGGLGCSPLRTQQQALFARNFVERGRNLLVRHRNRKTFALTNRAQDKKISDRLRHADAGGNRVGVFPARGVLGAVLERPHHRRAPRRLD